jgi:hypothetical protein
VVARIVRWDARRTRAADPHDLVTLGGESRAITHACPSERDHSSATQRSCVTSTRAGAACGAGTTDRFRRATGLSGSRAGSTMGDMTSVTVEVDFHLRADARLRPRCDAVDLNGFRLVLATRRSWPRRRLPARQAGIATWRTHARRIP